MRNLHYIGFIILVSFSSCDNDKVPPRYNPCTEDPFTSYITSTDLQNCRYLTSSYWVFIDSINNTLDSMVVISYKQDFTGNTICEYLFETHSFTTKSFDSKILTDYAVIPGGLFKDFSGSPYSGTQIYDDFNTDSSMTNYAVKHLDSIFIYDQYYRQVLRVEIEDDPTEQYNRSIYYFNSEFGFLKHDIYANDTLISDKVLMRKNIKR